MLAIFAFFWSRLR